MIPSGIGTAQKSLISSCLRASTQAVNRIATYFTNSDGWMPSGPRNNQRWAPLTGGMRNTPTSATTETSNDKPIRRPLASRWYGTFIITSMAIRPAHIQTLCRTM